MEGLMLWLRLLVQVVEYLLKAAVNFKDTDAGRQEWQDILDAYEEAVRIDIDGDGDIGRSPAPQASSARQQPRAPGNPAPAPENVSAQTVQAVAMDETGNRRIFE